jgi:hypothetical protein
MSLVLKQEAAIGRQRTVDFIFDEQGKQIGRCLAAWKYWQEHAPDLVSRLIGSRPISGDDRTILPLQAADLLAWQVRRRFVDEKTGKRHHIMDACEIPYALQTWDEERLRQMFGRIQRFKTAIGRSFPYDYGRSSRRDVRR